MCNKFPVHEFLPFFSMIIALLLSWENVLWFILYTCYYINTINHKWYGIYSLTPNSSVSVKIVTLILFFDSFLRMMPQPVDIAPPMWIFVFLCLLTLAHILIFIVQSRFYFIIFTASKALLLSSAVSVSASIGKITIFPGLESWYNCFISSIMSSTARYTKSLNFCSLHFFNMTFTVFCR